MSCADIPVVLVFVLDFERDGLIPVFEHVFLVVFHFEDPREFAGVTLELDHTAHFSARVAPPDISSAASHKSDGLGVSNLFREGTCLVAPTEGQG